VVKVKVLSVDVAPANPPGYGISGFVNNPFAALAPSGGKKK
jgi:hypothetical protein